MCVGLLLTPALAIAHFYIYTHIHTAPHKTHTHSILYAYVHTSHGGFFACVCCVCTRTCMHCQSEHITIVRARPQTQAHAEHSTRTACAYSDPSARKKTALVILGRKAAAARTPEKIASFENSTRMIVRISNLIFLQNINVYT